MEMKKYKLGEICDLNLSSLKASDELDEILYLDTSSITENSISALQKLSKKNAPSRAQRKVKDKTIIFSTVRPNQNHFGIMKNPKKNLIVSSGFTTLDVKNHKKFDAKYVYLKLTQPHVVNHLQTLAQNQVSSYPSINPDDIGNLSFDFPPLPTQQKIAAVLSALDDKIALNRRINAKLEQMAKRLYDHWFVQFDFPNADGKPYKASGGKMVWNETLKREIPSGWEVKRLGDIIIEISKSKIQVNQVKNEGDIPFFTSGENILKTDKPLTNGAKIFLSTGGNAVIKLYVGDAAYSTDTYCIEFDEYTFYIYLLLKSMIDYINTNLFTGSGLKHLQKEQFKSLYCVLPPKQLLKSFNHLVSTSYTHISRNTLQQEKLTALRDRLLPLLMNGQVEVE